MAKVEYKKEDIQLLTALLNMVAVKGFDNIVKEIPEKPQQSGKEAKNEAE